MVKEWTIIIAPIAEKRISKIPNPDKRRILTTIDELHSGLSGDLKPLKGREEWRLRVGNWRILLDIDIQALLILVKYVDSRGGVYKK